MKICLKMKESASFFVKKAAKNLPLAGGFGDAVALARKSKSFLLLFFKKEALSALFEQVPGKAA